MSSSSRSSRGVQPLNALKCECDPDLDYGPNNPDCPRHGEQVRHWDAWERGERRCPYCEGQSDEDWLAMCDCFMAEETLK